MARRSEHTRQQLKTLAIDAATKLAVEQGISGLTARKIASDIGYTPGTLYLMFKNLDELILHVNAQTLDNIYALMLSAFTRTDDAEQGVRNVVQAYMKFVEHNCGLWSCLYEHRMEAGKLPDWYAEKVERNFGLVEKALAQVASTHRHKDLVYKNKEHKNGVRKCNERKKIMQQENPIHELVDTSLFENVMVLPTTSNTADVKSVHLPARALWSAVHGVCMLSLNSSLGVAGVDSMELLVNHLTDVSLQSLTA